MGSKNEKKQNDFGKGSVFPTEREAEEAHPPRGSKMKGNNMLLARALSSHQNQKQRRPTPQEAPKCKETK